MMMMNDVCPICLTLMAKQKTGSRVARKICGGPVKLGAGWRRAKADNGIFTSNDAEKEANSRMK